MKKVIPIVFIILVLVFVGYYFYAQYPYSEGNRAGVLLKFSKKGYIFKTYEGEINMGGINATTNGTLLNNMWAFSVTDPTVGESMMQYEGKKVTVHYKQVIKNFAWQGETPYFVDKVEQIKD